MSRKKISAQKIEIDEETCMPKIVECKTSEEIEKKEPLSKKEIEKIEKLHNLKGSEQVKQITMNKVLGFEETNDIDKRKKFFKNLCTVLFIVLVVAVLVYTAYKDFFTDSGEYLSWEDAKEMFLTTWPYLIFALCSLFFAYLFKALKISILCKTFTKKWFFRISFQTAVIGHYFNNVTPLAVGGQPFEIYHLSKHGVNGGTAASISISTYVLNQFAFVFLAVASIIVYKNNLLHYEMSGFIPETVMVLAIIGLSLCFITPLLVAIFAIMPRLAASLVKFVMFLGGKLKIVKNPKLTTYKTIKSVCRNSMHLKEITRKPFAFIPTFIFSFGETIAYASIAYFTLKLFGFDLSAAGFLEWLQVVSISIIIQMAISFIPTPGNSGAADFSFYSLFSTYLAAGLGFPAMITWRLLNFYSFIIIGFVFSRVISSREKRKAKLQQNSQINP